MENNTTQSDPYQNAIEHQNIGCITIGPKKYELIAKYYKDGEIYFEATETIEKIMYGTRKKPKDIQTLTQNSKHSCDPEEFYNLFVGALNNDDNDLKLICNIDETNNRLCLDVKWTIPTKIKGNWIVQYPLNFEVIEQKDVDRMGKMMRDFRECKNETDNTQTLKLLNEQKETIELLGKAILDTQSQCDRFDKFIKTLQETYEQKIADFIFESMDEKINAYMDEKTNTLIDEKINEQTKGILVAVSNKLACVDQENGKVYLKKEDFIDEMKKYPTKNVIIDELKKYKMKPGVEKK